jgi:protocatechuate 3,4-dioxygenase, beta subunit
MNKKEDRMTRWMMCALFVPVVAVAQTPTVAPDNAPARITMAPAGEPGTPLAISGIVYAADGRTPVRNASIYVYQTDARGYYAPDNPRASDHPRLRGYLRTDANGRYEFRTIRPGSYPGTNNPGHIHYHVNAPDHAERVFEIVFADDPSIPARWREQARDPNSFVAIVELKRGGGGVWQGRQDVTLKRR